MVWVHLTQIYIFKTLKFCSIFQPAHIIPSCTFIRQIRVILIVCCNKYSLLCKFFTDCTYEIKICTCEFNHPSFNLKITIIDIRFFSKQWLVVGYGVYIKYSIGIMSFNNNLKLFLELFFVAYYSAFQKIMCLAICEAKWGAFKVMYSSFEVHPRF